MKKFWRKKIDIPFMAFFCAIFRTTNQKLKKAFSLITVYYVNAAIGLRWVRSKFQKDVAPTDGRLGIDENKKNPRQWEPGGDLILAQSKGYFYFEEFKIKVSPGTTGMLRIDG